MAAHAATKGAINALTRSIAVDYARDHIRANAVAPGHVLHETRDAEPDPGPARRAGGHAPHTARHRHRRRPRRALPGEPGGGGRDRNRPGPRRRSSTARASTLGGPDPRWSGREAQASTGPVVSAGSGRRRPPDVGGSATPTRLPTISGAGSCRASSPMVSCSPSRRILSSATAWSKAALRDALRILETRGRPHGAAGQRRGSRRPPAPTRDRRLHPRSGARGPRGFLCGRAGRLEAARAGVCRALRRSIRPAANGAPPAQSGSTSSPSGDPGRRLRRSAGGHPGVPRGAGERLRQRDAHHRRRDT